MRRSLALSYLLWALFGYAGGHRFYLRSHRWGFLYLLTGGLFSVGWLVDFFLLPGRVDAVNRQLEREAGGLPCARLVREAGRRPRLGPLAHLRGVVDAARLPGEAHTLVLVPVRSGSRRRDR